MAQLLVDEGEATPDDFWVCSGYAGWAPGQLQGELDRGGWYMVATDTKTIFNLIQNQPSATTTTTKDDTKTTTKATTDEMTGIKVWDELMTKSSHHSVGPDVGRR